MGKVFPNASLETKNKLLELIGKYGEQFGLDNKYAVQHFLAQAGYESGGLTDLSKTENLNYSVQNLLDNFSNLFSQTNPNKADPDDYAGNAKKIGNFVYSKTNSPTLGNGDVSSGDGYRYRGRGIFQLTGKSNYQQFTNFAQNNLAMTTDFVANPGQVANDPKAAILSAMWFFKEHVLDHITIDKNTSVEKVTTLVNGPKMNGLNGRKNNFDRTKSNINCNN